MEGLTIALLVGGLVFMMSMLLNAPKGKRIVRYRKK